MQWNVAAPFFRAGSTARWIDDYVPAGRHSFRKIPFGGDAPSAWHGRGGRGTPLSSWRDYWRTGGAATRGADGVITVFPQLAVTASLHRLLRRDRGQPMVAWCFNIGRMPRDWRRAAARRVLAGVDRFVVHSRAEIALIADFLDLPEERVRFVPLQRAPIATVAEEDHEQPFALAMGSANRDYATLVEAARRTGLPLTIVAAPRCVEGLDLPANVTLRSGLDSAECRILAQKARFSVVPLEDVGAASGQVTVVEAQRMARAVIATRSIGTVDYVEDDASGLLVGPGDVAAMGAAMQRLWDDAGARQRLATGGAAFAEANLSDEAAGRALGRLLDELR